ncbi:MAG: hypothetical protein JNM18_24100, partial [Planctomycetaceae bacterium]|nr:hypothetical protein [Planctomycetaceae bacterium]
TAPTNTTTKPAPSATATAKPTTVAPTNNTTAPTTTAKPVAKPTAAPAANVAALDQVFGRIGTQA